MEAEGESVKLEVPGIAIENTELAGPQHATILLTHMPGQGIIQKGRDDKRHDDRGREEPVHDVVEPAGMSVHGSVPCSDRELSEILGD